VSGPQGDPPGPGGPRRLPVAIAYACTRLLSKPQTPAPSCAHHPCIAAPRHRPDGSRSPQFGQGGWRRGACAKTLIEGSLVGVFLNLAKSARLVASSLILLSISSRELPSPLPRSAVEASGGRPWRHPVAPAPTVGCARPLSLPTRRALPRRRASQSVSRDFSRRRDPFEATPESPNGLSKPEVGDCSEFGKSCIMQASGYVRCL
jgi:hypothetical protein